MQITIRKKLLLWFMFLTIILGTGLFFLLKDIEKGREDNVRTYQNSALLLNSLYSLLEQIEKADELLKYSIQERSIPPPKIQKKIYKKKYKKIINELKQKRNNQPEDINNQIERVVTLSDSLMRTHRNLFNGLISFEVKGDPVLYTELQEQIAKNGEANLLKEQIIDQMNNLKNQITPEIEDASLQLDEKFDKITEKIYLVAISIFFIMFVVIILLIRNILRPIDKITKSLDALSKGQIPKYDLDIKEDEIGRIALGINNISKGLTENVKFAQELGKGNYTSTFLINSKDNVLANSLLKMREEFVESEKEQDKRKKEDKQRNWATQGIAKFSELLRENNENLEELAYSVIGELTHYLEANQGGLFIKNEDNPDDIYIQMLACYAYNRRKLAERRIEIGDTIVGQCVLESESIYMTDIPRDYLKITSGLGEDNPNHLLVVPLTLNEKTIGVVEIASFYKIEKYQRDFVEKIGEMLAGTFINIKTNLNTARLLEESQEISERLAQQEEEMRQNMEEMRATQEEIQNHRNKEAEQYKRFKGEYETKVKEMQDKFNHHQKVIDKQKIKIQNTLNAVDHSIGLAEFSLNGVYMNVNARFTEITKMKLHDLKDVHHNGFMSEEAVNSEGYQGFWDKLKEGEAQSGGHQYFFKGKEMWLYETFTPVRDINGSFYKIIALSYNISKVREKQADYKKTIDILYKRLEDANNEIEKLNQ